MVTIEERVSNLETEFRTELRHLATKADLAELRTELKAEIQASQNRVIFSMIGLMAGGVAAIFGIMRFLA